MSNLNSREVNFSWVKNEFLRDYSFSQSEFYNCDSEYIPFKVDNLGYKFTHDNDYSKIPTLAHNLEHLVFNEGVLSMRDLYRIK